MVSFNDVATEEYGTDTRSIEIQHEKEANVGKTERIVMGAVGGLLAFEAIRKPTLTRLLLGAVGGALVYRSASGYCPMYERLGINNAREGAAQPHDYYRNGIHVSAAYIIQRDVQELFDFWKNFENLPRFMKHLEAVQRVDENRWRWVARGPAGKSVTWEAEVINEEPGRLIAWRSLENADVDNAGSVRFLPAVGNRGTEVRVEIEYIPPAGKIGQAIAWLFGEEPQQQVRDDLRRFKQFMETGEIPTTEGQPRGSCTTTA